MSTQEDETTAYRIRLVVAEQKSQEDYDKTLVTLSGGALGLSILFIKDIIGKGEPQLVGFLVTAWICWALSLTSVVISYYLSRKALRTAIEQTDKKDYSGGVGGDAAKLTEHLNAASGIFFVIGVATLIVFAANNIGATQMSGKDKPEKGYIPPTPAPTKDPVQPINEGVIPEPPPPTPPPTRDSDSS